MSDVKMLGEIIHYCSKCKLDLNHRITLMEGTQPSRVLCLTCNSERAYKDPAKAKARASKAAVSLTGAKKAKARQTSEEKNWQQELANEDVTPIKYNIKGEFELNNHVVHPKFGRGLVIGFDYPDKVHIYFDGGVKVLKGLKAQASQ